MPILCAHELDALLVHLVFPSARHMAPRVRAFVDFAVKEFVQLALIHPNG